MLKFFKSLLGAVLLWGLSFQCCSADVANYDGWPVSVQIDTNTQAVHPSQTLKAMVVFGIADGWHILAANPGDFGLPTEIKWQIPEGYKIISEKWSDTETFKSAIGVQYGFENKAFYLVEFQPDEAIQSSADFQVNISWQACNEECLPQKTSLSFSLPVSGHNVFPTQKWQKLLQDMDAVHDSSLVPVSEASEGVWWFMLAAFVGGIILNLMPCVLPILSLKILNLVKNVSQIRQARIDALFYALGVIVCFVGLAFLIMLFKKSGEAVGWGFQLQSPYFVAVLLVIFVLITLMFLDIIHINFALGNRWRVSEGKGGAFLTGVFSVVIASSCSAPFMATAVGYALMQPTHVYLPVFVALALGYALPFVLIGLAPNLIAKILPKPGKWMVKLKHFLAIPMILTCLWLAWILQAQIFNHPKDYSSQWEEFDRARIQNLVESGEKVFIDYSAKWCLTCLMNEQLVLDKNDFLDWADAQRIHLFRADWTDGDEDITRSLFQFGRNSVPLYIFYINKQPFILPQILTLSVIKQYLK